jgi:hypothetical protein
MSGALFDLYFYYSRVRELIGRFIGVEVVSFQVDMDLGA